MVVCAHTSANDVPAQQMHIRTDFESWEGGKGAGAVESAALSAVFEFWSSSFDTPVGTTLANVPGKSRQRRYRIGFRSLVNMTK